MNKRVTSKETLAKLMATENIFVEHANVPTAGFDLINRKLLLPNWKNISDDVYTLLISHEVGHALFTPTEQWEKAIISTKDSAFKQVVNIVEDVRIEKLIQAKYPGSVRAFRSGYDELEKSNLFGTKDREIDSYGLLDRLNLHFKLGHYGYANVPFSDKEKPWVDRVSSCKSFADVLRVATELKQFVEENPESQGDNNAQSENAESASVESMQSQSQNGSNNSNQQTQQSVSIRSKSGDAPESKDSQSAPSEGNNQDPNSNEVGQGQSEGVRTAEIAPQKVCSETQNHFDSAIQDLVDKSILNTEYANFPDIELDKLVVPHKTVHQQISQYYSTHFQSVYASAEKQVEQFKNNSKNIVNQLANIFEMKKKAKLDVRSLTSRTGKLDTNRIYSYRYNDDVFKKLTITPQGKSHGLVMFIDMSSSMSENIAGTFEQLLNLVLFCRRVNIPFDVYGFTDTYAARMGMQPHPSKVGDLIFDSTFCLRHYFSSTMTGAEFNVALQNIICIMRHYSGLLYAGLPPQETLNTTPLVPAIMVATKLVTKFRADHGLDIVNTIFLSDGEDTHGLTYNNGTAGRDFYSGRSYYAPSRRTEKYFVRDVKTRKQWEVKNATADMLNILRETTGVKVIGFHIIKKREVGYTISRYVANPKEVDKHVETFKQHKFAELTNVSGYDAYYMIPSGDGLSVSPDSDFDSNIDTTVDWEDEKQAKKAMKNVTKSFKNFMTQKMTSRILLNRFIEHIS